ncbi:MAG: rhamnan synthesis F family protein [Clostridium sp.]|nr:rhamnan synthesis F family protein [Clostridium sp.]
MYHIISDNKKTTTELDIEKLKAAVLVHLYYDEQVEFYREYLERIPHFIDIILISSKDTILELFASDRFQKIKKENRGRDISALLVAAKDVLSQYEYICFIHDKKEKSLGTKAFVDVWRKNLWDNMLRSDIYIYNILELFESEKNIGMFVPLPPHKRDIGTWLHASWGSNYQNTRKLAETLGVMADISSAPPLHMEQFFGQELRH